MTGYKLRRYFFVFVLAGLFFCFFSCLNTSAEINTLLPGEKSTLTENVETNTNDETESPVSIIETAPENSLNISDSFFANPSDLTFKGLAVRVFFIVIILLCILILTKGFLKKRGYPQKLGHNLSGFANPDELNLKQTLMLTPTQCLYVVETGGKKLLLGGTYQGGVQFLTELSDKSEAASVYKNPLVDNFNPNPSDVSLNQIQENPFPYSVTNSNSDLKNQKAITDDLSANVFKKRGNFRKSLNHFGLEPDLKTSLQQHI